MRRFALLTVVATIAAASAAFTTWDDDAEEAGEMSVKLAETPPAVRKAIQAAAGDAEVTEVEKETEGGVTLYEAAWMIDGVEHEICVAESGETVETETKVAADTLPEAVRRAVAKKLPQGTMPEYERKTVVLYEVEATIDGEEMEFLVDPAGRIMELEADEDHGNGSDDDDDGDS